MNSATVQEIDEQPLAVTRNRGRSGGRVGMLAGLRLAAVHLRLPYQFAIVPIQAENRLGFLHGIGRSHINAIANDGRGAMAAPRNRHLPKDILVFVPLEGWLLA